VSAPASPRRRWLPGGVWQSPAFVSVWGASVISTLGSSVTSLALPLLAALTLHATPWQMGLLVAAETAPILLFGLVTGVWVDRRAKRPVMIATDFGRAALLLAVPLLAWLGVLRIEHLLAIAFLVGTLGVLFEIASQSYLPAILTTEELTEGNARLQTGWGLAEAGGPGLAGWLTQIFSAPAAILVDAVSYAVSGFLLAGIRVTEPPAAHPEGVRPHFWQELKEGLQLVLRLPILRATAAATGVWNLFDGVRITVLVLFLTRTLGLEAGAIGIVFTAGAAGFLVGSLFPAWIARRMGLGPAILLGIVASVPGEALLSLAAGPPAIAAAMATAGSFLAGVTISIYDINQFSLRQAVTPLRLQGRVNATMRTIIRGALPLGALLGGALAELIGLRGAMLVALLGPPLAFLAIWFSPVRSLTRLPERVEDETPRAPLAAEARS
jgi:MFS family permease